MHQYESRHFFSFVLASPIKFLFFQLSLTSATGEQAREFELCPNRCRWTNSFDILDDENRSQRAREPVVPTFTLDSCSGAWGRKCQTVATYRGVWPPGGAKSAPYGIAITPDGMVWYSESGVKPNTIIQFDPRTEKFARANIPSGGGTVRNMAATSDGRVYIACSGVDKVGVVEPAR